MGADAGAMTPGSDLSYVGDDAQRTSTSTGLASTSGAKDVVGWMLAPHESAALAERLIAATCAIQPGQLTVHADRGAAMTSKPVALLLADLGVTKTHSRPQVSNDNPFSEAQFKTLK